MNRINRNRLAALTAVLLLAGSAWATSPPATPEDTSVHVSYVAPENFSENRFNGQQDRYNRTEYLGPLRDYLVKQATPILAPGQQLEINITDISLAGAYEPWRGGRWGDVRIMKDQYPPRIALNFKLTDSDGKVLREGSRKLIDMAYLTNGLTSPGDSDSLRYDKAMLNRWLHRELAKR